MPPPVGLSFTEVDADLVVHCSLPAPRPTLELAALRETLNASGYDNWRLSDEALSGVLAAWNGAADSFEQRLARGHDASFAITINKDLQQAWVSIVPSRGGRALQLEDLLAALSAAGVQHGVDTATLQAACAADEAARVLAAAASPPVAGVDTRFELLVADTRDRSPKVDALGHIDFHQLGDIPVVKAGQPLMRRHPPTPGTDGMNVLGEAMVAEAGKDIPFEAKLVGATIDKDDPNLLRAAVNGQPVRTAAAVMVEQILRLKNVSMASGNIDFDGTIEVAEDVQPGMKVHATGDVVVKGTVEGAQILCDGNLQVSGGIIAHAKVHAGQAISARFAENAELHAKTVIAIADMAVHCTLEALNEILVGSKTARRSRLVGGSSRAMMRVQAHTVGAAAGGVTRIQVGINPDLDRRLSELVAQAAQQKAEEDKLAKVVKHLEQQGDPRGLLPQLRTMRKKLLGDWGKTLAEQSEVEGELALTANARVEVLAGVDGDLDVQFGKLLRHVRQTLGPGWFGLADDGKLVFTGTSGQLTPLG